MAAETRTEAKSKPTLIHAATVQVVQLSLTHIEALEAVTLLDKLNSHIETDGVRVHEARVELTSGKNIVVKLVVTDDFDEWYEVSVGN